MSPRQLLALASFASIAAVVPVAARASGSPEPGEPPAAPAPVDTAPPAAPTPISVPVAATPASAPGPLDKSPSFEVRDRGDSVEIIAHNVKAARTAVIPVRQRLEVPIVAGASAKRTTPTDPTVKLVEFDNENTVHVLSVKLSFERADVKTLSRFVQAIQVGDDLHMLVPRKLPADGEVPKLPGPTLPPELAAAVARIDQAGHAAKPEAKAEMKAEAKSDAKPAKLEAKPEAKPDDAKLAAAVVTAKQAGPEVHAVAVSDEARRTGSGSAAAAASDPHALNQVLAPNTDDAWSKISMYGALGLAAAGAGIWLMRRRRTQTAPLATIEVLAQRSLGGKARILWLSAGSREMMVSVTPQHVRLLTQWRKTDAAASQPAGAPVRITGPLPASMHGALPAAYADAVPAAYAGTIPPYAAAAVAATSAARERTSGRIERAASERTSQRMRAASEHDDAADLPDADKVDKPVSPAVSGILRLRSRTGQMAVPDAVATTDLEADADWAKELIAATGARQ